MKSTIAKSTMSLVIVGLFAAGCTTPQSHTADVTPIQPQPISYVGPPGATGATGATGSTGPQGEVGITGAQGARGNNNVASVDATTNGNYSANDSSATNPVPGDTGAQGNAAPSWKYTFMDPGAAVQSSDDRKTRDIANYLNQNPTSQITVNGPGRPYVHSVVETLTNAGVPRSKIQIGPSTDATVDNGHEVDVNISN